MYFFLFITDVNVLYAIASLYRLYLYIYVWLILSIKMNLTIFSDRKYNNIIVTEDITQW